jgi:hypothetical protein
MRVHNRYITPEVEPASLTTVTRQLPSQGMPWTQLRLTYSDKSSLFLAHMS